MSCSITGVAALAAVASTASALASSVEGTADTETSSKTNSPYEEVITTATRLSRKASDVAGTISVFSKDDIERELVAELADVVRYQPGVSVANSQRGGNQGFVIRGIGGVRVLNLVDGIRSVDNYFSNGRDLFETDDLTSVEIIRGPASALYGADALGGVVLLNTKDPEDYLSQEEQRYFAANFSSDQSRDEGKVGLVGAAKGSWGAGLLQYTRRQFSEQELNSSARFDPLDGVSDNLLVKWSLPTGDNHRVVVALDSFHERNDFELDSQEVRGVTEATGEDRKQRNRFSVAHNWTLENTLADSLHTRFYWQDSDGLQTTRQRRTGFSFASAPTGTPVLRVSDFEFNQQVQGLDLVAHRGFSQGSFQHTVVYGLTYETLDTERPRNRTETNLTTGQQTTDIIAFPFAPAESFPNKTFPDTESTRWGLYGQNEIVFGDSGLTLIPALRYDAHKLTADSRGVVDTSALGGRLAPLDEGELSLNFGALYALNDNLTLSVQYAEGFRPPNYSDANQSFVNRAFGYAVIPNPNLQPETSKGIEVGLKARFDQGFVDFALYQNDYRNFIDSGFLRVDQGIRVFQNRNIDSVEIRGAELNGQWYLAESWSLRGSLAYARGDNHTEAAPLDSVDPLNGVLGLSYAEPTGLWGVETRVSAATRQKRLADDGNTAGAGYGVVDLIGHYQLADNTLLRIGAFNVFDKAYAQWNDLRGVDASDASAIALAQQSGRQLRASVRVEF
ncbi:TonB-dependent hemoglobin/transferrin/lactoferrin family receptor [bacterium SCSIO 12696]|nr:TonB-dependent hemoglobin/transferrin/lactoferrin family receptor [bacterium SCSIO 12696]